MTNKLSKILSLFLLGIFIVSTPLSISVSAEEDCSKYAPHESESCEKKLGTLTITNNSNSALDYYICNDFAAESNLSIFLWYGHTYTLNVGQKVEYYYRQFVSPNDNFDARNTLNLSIKIYPATKKPVYYKYTENICVTDQPQMIARKDITLSRSEHKNYELTGNLNQNLTVPDHTIFSNDQNEIKAPNKVFVQLNNFVSGGLRYYTCVDGVNQNYENISEGDHTFGLAYEPNYDCSVIPGFQIKNMKKGYKYYISTIDNRFENGNTPVEVTWQYTPYIEYNNFDPYTTGIKATDSEKLELDYAPTKLSKVCINGVLTNESVENTSFYNLTPGKYNVSFPNPDQSCGSIENPAQEITVSENKYQFLNKAYTIKENYRGGGINISEVITGSNAAKNPTATVQVDTRTPVQKCLDTVSKVNSDIKNISTQLRATAQSYRIKYRSLTNEIVKNNRARNYKQANQLKSQRTMLFRIYNRYVANTYKAVNAIYAMRLIKCSKSIATYNKLNPKAQTTLKNYETSKKQILSLL